MFERYRAWRATRRYEKRQRAWQAQRDGLAGLLELAQSFAGEPSTELVLKPGEAAFATVSNVALIEDRRGPGHWQGRSRGVSVPVASVGGHAIRYHVGSARGHFVQGAPMATAVDTGTVYITNRRIVFEGQKQTRVCPFEKLLGVHHDDSSGTTVLSVSNRQAPITLHYGAALAGWFDFRIELALAHWRNEVPALVSQLRHDLDIIERERPSPPATAEPPARNAE